MKISLEWLGQFLPGVPLAADLAADALTNGGLPVELVERHGDDTVPGEPDPHGDVDHHEPEHDERGRPARLADRVLVRGHVAIVSGRGAAASPESDEAPAGVWRR